jgi:hypothetical protein
MSLQALRRLCRAFMSDDQNIEIFKSYVFHHVLFSLVSDV